MKSKKRKKKKKKSITLKASQNDSEVENLEDSSDKDGEIYMLTRNFRLLIMNVRNRVTSKVSALNSSLSTKEQRIGRRFQSYMG